jgi:hypothetical protein
MALRNRWFCPALLLWPIALGAQTPPELASIVERLDRLEQENRALSEEVKALRAELAASRGTSATTAGTPAVASAPNPATVEERLDIQERRTDEQAQTKVEASQKFPIRITGMALFNTYLNSRQNGGMEYPTVAAAGDGRAGATLRQTTIGLEFRGPETVWSGRVSGSLYMDFYNGGYNGAGTPTSLNEWFRLRTGSIGIDWKSRGVMVGVEKPIFNPREPTSLAQVGISPLTGAGNLWLWMPQVRVEQDLSFGASTGVEARMGAVETQETLPYGTPASPVYLASNRPGLEGRFNFYHRLDDERRLEIAPGFHASTTHVNGFSVPSNLFSMDWFLNPWRPVEFTGAFFTGQNVANLGTGAINQGYVLYRRYASAIGSRGGWGQFTIHAARRLDLHLFTGEQDDDNTLLRTGDIGKNLVYGANLYCHLAPNVILAPEVTQLRTMYIGLGTRINNHYDLALAYLF